MNADSAFAIGKKHEVCQDYAVAGMDGRWAHVIVSDGCSSSRDSDIGARLLALSARQALRATGEDVFRIPADDTGLVAVSGAMMAAKVLDLPPETLDATLLSIVTDGENILLSAFGDGAFKVEWKSGRTEQILVDFPSGYPDYLSYRIDSARREKYDRLGGYGVVARTKYGPKNMDYSVPTVREEKGSLEPHCAFSTCLPIQEENDRIVLAAAMSDGVKSFYKRGENGASESVPPDAVLRGLLEFKLHSGRFVQRRLNKFLKDMAQLGYEHYDDVAVAAIHFGG